MALDVDVRRAPSRLVRLHPCAGGNWKQCRAFAGLYAVSGMLELRPSLELRLTRQCFGLAVRGLADALPMEHELVPPDVAALEYAHALRFLSCGGLIHFFFF